MSDPVVAAPAAPSQSAQNPASQKNAGSVERLQSSPEPEKPLPSFNDAFEQHFRNKIKATPEEAEQSAKSKDKSKPEAREEPKTEPKQQAPETPPEEKKLSKIVDPESLVPGKEVKSKEAQANWKQLTENSKLIYKENEKLLSKVKDLEAVVTQKGGLTQKEIETLKAQVEELRPYREMVDIQHDPDFRKNYDEPMEASKKAIHKILKDLQTPEETISIIDFNNPAQVDKVVAVMEEAGQKTLARRILAHADDIQKLTEKRNEALGNAKVKFSEFSKNREQSTLAKRTEEEAIVNQAVERAYQTKNAQGESEVPFFNMRELPPNSTKEQIDEVEAHNKMAENLQGHVQAVLKANDPESRAMNAVRAIVGAVRDAQLKGALARLNEVEEELKRVSSAGTEKRNVTSGKPVSTVSSASTTEEAMGNFFANRRR